MSPLVGALAGTLGTATPLLLAALGETVVQRSGVVNVGIEGMMLTGAFAAVIGARNSGNPYVGLALAVFAGVLAGLLFAAFAVKLSANQVVIGVVLNLLAVGLTGTLYRAIFGSSEAFLTVKALPIVMLGATILTPFAAVAALTIAWWLMRTRRGLELRACGEQPYAAEAAGVNVNRTRTTAILFGGAMAGIAGAYLSIGESNTFVEQMTSGRGFIALAIVTSGRWNPWGCVAASLVFGFVEALQFQWQALGLHLPYQLFLALPYVVTLLILSVGGAWAAAPAALGRPFRRA